MKKHGPHIRWKSCYDPIQTPMPPSPETLLPIVLRDRHGAFAPVAALSTIGLRNSSYRHEAILSPLP
jgi:hypothetical protein